MIPVAHASLVQYRSGWRSSVAINGGTFNLGGNTQVLSALNGNGGTLGLGGGLLVLNTAQSNTLASALSGNGIVFLCILWVGMLREFSFGRGQRLESTRARNGLCAESVALAYLDGRCRTATPGHVEPRRGPSGNHLEKDWEAVWR